MNPRSTTRSARTILPGRPLAAAGLLTIVLAAASAVAPSGSAPAPPPAAAQSCPPLPAGLSPAGPGPTRFTMLIRINQQVNVDTYTNFDEASGGLGGRVRPQDVFVINTRFEKSSPELAYDLATQLHGTFPCNRIVALNGMGLNPSVPGYAFALLDHPDVHSLFTDFEPMDWNQGRASEPSRPPWNYKFFTAFKRIKSWTGRLNGATASSSIGTSKRIGLAPVDSALWNYGQIAQVIDKRNRRLGAPKLGPLSVQTQDSCANGGAAGFSARGKALFHQYRFKIVKKRIKVRVKSKKKGKKRFKKKTIKVKRKIKKKGRPLLSNLAMQISFSDSPDPKAGMAILRTSPATAAQCARAGLKRGGGAFFFFASDESMRLLFNQPQISSLRPPPAS